MKAKKSKKANLERLRFTFLLIGLLGATSIVLSAFEWRTFEEKPRYYGEEILFNQLEDEVILALVPPKTEVKPKQEVAQRPVVDEFVFTEDEAKIDIPLDIPDWEEEEPMVLDIGDIVEVVDDPDFFIIVEEMPEFPGGVKAMYQFIGSEINYPAMAKDAGVQGVVHLVFVVNEEGDITNLKVEQGIGSGCDEEAMRVIQRMPKWKPGKQRGKAVKVQYRIPINYKLS